MPAVSEYELMEKVNIQPSGNWPVLKPGQVHIWKVDLDKAVLSKDLQNVLSQDERKRAGRMLSELKQRQFTAARAALRQLLSLYTGQPAHSLRFGYGPMGKPCLQNNKGMPGLEFNISHSGALMLAAFSLDEPLGIDLECEQVISAQDWIVKRFFSAHDHLVYQNIPAGRKQAAFLKAWTAKEACGKSHGAGFSANHDLDHLRPDEPDLPSNSYEISMHGPYWLLRFRPQTGFIATAALKADQKPQPVFLDHDWHLTHILA